MNLNAVSDVRRAGPMRPEAVPDGTGRDAAPAPAPGLAPGARVRIFGLQSAEGLKVGELACTAPFAVQS